MTIRAGIIGGAGYTGGELIRLLLNHPQVSLAFVQSSSHAGQPLYAVHRDLLGDTELLYSAKAETPCDIMFLCVGHGDARRYLEAHPVPESTRIIDLSQDFRMNRDTFVYGLPEAYRADITSASMIANPGCFATAIQLALLPLVRAGQFREAYVTGITGSTGAGQGLSPTGHFSWRSGNIQAYKSLTHQHLEEIGLTFRRLSPNEDLVPAVHFIPWRGNFTRGIYVSAVMESALNLSEAYALFETAYADAAFTHVSREMIDLKQVVNTNKCVLHVEAEGGRLVVHAAIDNLLKGASGQAVQNMNLMFGLPEESGLQLKATGF